MASVNFTEKDYDAVAAAIYDFHMRGENETAESDENKEWVDK